MTQNLTDEMRPRPDLVIPWRDVSACLDWLSQTFETTFQIWDWDQQWELVSPCEPNCEPKTRSAIFQFIESLSQNTAYQTKNISNKTAIAIIPLESLTFCSRIAVAQIPKDCAQSLQRVIQLFLDQTEKNRVHKEQTILLQNQTSQPAVDVEELGWLRTLVDNLAFQEGSYELSPSANQALSQLKELIQTETIVVVLKSQNDTKLDASYEAIYAMGETPVDEDLVNRLLELAGPNSFCQSYINNQVQHNSSQLPRQIQSVAVIPALCRNRCYGWLIAINKQSVPTQQDSFSNIPCDHSPVQFDTKNAMLIESAASILATHAHNAELLDEQKHLLVGTVRTLVDAIDTKDPYTRGHSDRVGRIAKVIARQYGLSEEECQKVYLTGLLHDIGKIGIRDEILTKPGKLTEAEFEEIKQHPALGYEILRHLTQLQYVLPGVLHHHESWDGSGYPYQLSGEEIPLVARILAVADAYDAITSDRPYRMGLEPAIAEQFLIAGRNQQWDPHVIDAFFNALEEIHDIIWNKPSNINVSMQNPESIFENSYVTKDSIHSAVFKTTLLSNFY